MAQVPWTVVSSRPSPPHEARDFTARCVRSLSRRPSGITCTVGAPLAGLQHLVEDFCSIETNSFHVVTAKGTVFLHPCFLNSAEFGTRMFLSNYLLKYLPEFDGIWVAFGKVLPLERAGHIAESEMWVVSIFQVQIECLVFRPAPGAVLVGKVNQVRPSHLGLLVNGMFNVCIRRAGLHKRYELKGNEYHAKRADVAPIRLGDLVAFRIFRYHYSAAGDISTLEGSLADARCTGVVDSTGELMLSSDGGLAAIADQEPEEISRKGKFEGDRGKDGNECSEGKKRKKPLDASQRKKKRRKKDEAAAVKGEEVDDSAVKTETVH